MTSGDTSRSVHGSLPVAGHREQGLHHRQRPQAILQGQSVIVPAAPPAASNITADICQIFKYLVSISDLLFSRFVMDCKMFETVAHDVLLSKYLDVTLARRHSNIKPK